MDLVTNSLLQTFQAEESLQDEKDSAVLFEHFANFCALANEYGEEFDVEGGHDLGHVGAVAGEMDAVLQAGGLESNFDGRTMESDRKSTRLNSSHIPLSRMPSSA